MDQFKIKHLLIISGIVVLDLILVFLNQNTYDSGDSVLHYLYSSQAFEYPGYFMDHWAKPLFVLLSAPFTFSGWWGMQLFNSLCMLGACYYTALLLREYGFSPWLAIVFCFFAPKFFLVQSSGLTEPLFTLCLISIIFYLKKEQFISALIILSFLPFVRSEGWIIIPIIIFYLLIVKRYKFLPWMLLGTFVYGIAGYFYYDDFLWILHQNPYSGVESKYGNGNWLHYLNQLPYVVGFVMFFLFVLGCIAGLKNTIQSHIDKVELFLIYGIVVGYITAHSIFWAMGLFHSFGLNRVLIVIIPLLAFIACRGVELLTKFFPRPGLIWTVCILAIILFPFSSNKSGFNFPETYRKEASQQLIDKVYDWADRKYLLKNYSIYYGNTYIPMRFKRDIDDPASANRIGLLKQYPPLPSSLIIWDSYFAPSDQDIYSEELQGNSQLKLLHRFNCEDCRETYFVEVYETIE